MNIALWIAEGVITDGASPGILQGPVSQWVEELTNLAITYCFDTFVLWAEGEGQLTRFSERTRSS